MTERITQEKVGAYMKVSREYLQTGLEADDFIYNQLTAILHAKVYSKAEEEGEITVFIERPTFFDWLFRRTKEKKIGYKIRELVKSVKMKFNDNIRVIEFDL